MNDRVEQFVQLLTAHQASIHAFALALLHNRADADEVLQEASLVLWRKFDAFEDGTDFRAWALQVTYFEVRRFLRQPHRRAGTFSDEFLDRVAHVLIARAGRDDPRHDALDDCLKRLPDTDREMILLRYEPESSVETVAEKFGRSTHTVYKALQRIRHGLHDCIERLIRVEERT